MRPRFAGFIVPELVGWRQGWLAASCWYMALGLRPPLGVGWGKPVAWWRWAVWVANMMRSAKRRRALLESNPLRN